MDNQLFIYIASLCLGIGLSASCGFRVFVPMLVAALAAKFGGLPLAANMQWMASWTAIICLGTATIVEIGAYYIPWLDHLLDTITSPASLLAGTLLTASVLTGMDPAWQWGLGLIVGGGSAGMMQTGTVALRLGSAATTGGVGNPFVATLEHIAAFLGSLLALWIPILTALFFACLFVYLGYRVMRKKTIS